MSLFRYTKIDVDGYLIENLKNNQIYFPSPSIYNDPYEFIFKFDVADEIYEDFIKLIYGNRSNQIFQNCKSKKEVLEDTEDYYFSDNSNSFGVACFTESENDDIMWAHYADSHKGVCIEYDNTKYPFNCCEKVKYVQDVFTVVITNLNDLNDINKMTDMILRKNIIWEYEKEWRLIQNAGDKLTYNNDAIKSITFGFNCSPISKKIIYDATSHLDIRYDEVIRSKHIYCIAKQQIRR